MSNTLLEITSEAYFMMWAKTTSVTYALETIMKPEVNRLQREVCRWRVVNLITGTPIVAGDLKFMRKDHFFTIVPQTTLSADVTTASVTLPLTDSSAYDSSGAVLVNEDIVLYGANAANTLSSVTDIDRRHYDGDKVYQLYSLPADFWKPIDLYYEGEKLEMKDQRWWQPYDDTYREVVTNDSWVSYMHIYWLNNTRDVVKMVYIKDCTDMSDDSDTTNLPDDYWVKVLAPLLAWSRLLDTEQGWKAKELLAKAYANLTTMYRGMAETRREFRKKTKVAPFTYL